MKSPEFFESRRGFLRGIKKTAEAGAVIGTLAALRQGVTFSPLSETYAEVNPADIEAYSNFNPITIAHRAGNHPESIRRAARAKMKFVDIDANKTGGTLYADHSNCETLGDSVLFGIDIDTLAFRIGPPHFELRETLEIAAQENVGASIELKRGDFTSFDVEKIYGWANDLEVPVLFHSENFDRVDMARKTIGDPSKTIYVPKNNTEWLRIFTEQDYERRSSVLTNAGSAIWQLDLLKDYDMTIYVGRVNSTSTVRELKDQGVTRFMNGRKVLEKLFPQAKAA